MRDVNEHVEQDSSSGVRPEGLRQACVTCYIRHIGEIVMLYSHRVAAHTTQEHLMMHM